jgi:hypothetical protein
VFKDVSASAIEVFCLSWRSPLVGVLALFFVILGAFAWPHVGMLVALTLQLVLSLAILLLLSSVTVGPEGVVLYRINRLQWSQVTAVRRVSFLGLPYLLITRAKGFRWWLPLYFSGPRPIEVALADKAPPGNPLRLYLQTPNNALERTRH